MQDKMLASVLISIPLDDIGESGIDLDGVIVTTVMDGKITIENLKDSGSVVCDGDCGDCPIHRTDCDGNCVECPCADYCEEKENF